MYANTGNGIVLIINNETFDDQKKYETRLGTQVNVDTLTALLDQFGIDQIIYKKNQMVAVDNKKYIIANLQKMLALTVRLAKMCKGGAYDFCNSFHVLTQLWW
jgi:hypothetical protein